MSCPSPPLSSHANKYVQMCAHAGTSVGVGFAIPGDMVTRIVPQLISNGRVVRPSLGIQVRPAYHMCLLASLLACLPGCLPTCLLSCVLVCLSPPWVLCSLCSLCVQHASQGGLPVPPWVLCVLKLPCAASCPHNGQREGLNPRSALRPAQREGLNPRSALRPAQREGLNPRSALRPAQTCAAYAEHCEWLAGCGC